MDKSDLIVQQEGDVLTILLDRPGKLNAITTKMYSGMADALSFAEDHDAIRSVIFAGAGQAFCAGNDLDDFVRSPPVGNNAHVMRFLRGLAGATKILISAVQGKAIGIGATMLLHCDFVLAEEGAEFQMPFVDLALVPEAASSLLLPNLVGQRRAAELLLLGERICADRAVELGLVNRLVPPGHTLTEARKLAARLAEKPAGALRATKILMKSSAHDVQGRIEEESLAFSHQLQTPEARSIIARFLAKCGKLDAQETIASA